LSLVFARPHPMTGMRAPTFLPASRREEHMAGKGK
jgi:hypothetical protein